MALSGDWLEARETRKVPNQSFGPDIFAEVESAIALLHRPPLARNPDQVDGPSIEGDVQVEIVARCFRTRKGPRDCGPICVAAFGDQLFTLSLSALAMVIFTTLSASLWICWPVAGLRTMRAGRSRQ